MGRLLDEDRLWYNIVSIIPDDAVYLNDLYEIIKKTEESPRRIEGHWLKREYEDNGLPEYDYQCSCCGDWQDYATPYCPDCGAKMPEWRKDQ